MIFDAIGVVVVLLAMVSAIDEADIIDRYPAWLSPLSAFLFACTYAVRLIVGLVARELVASGAPRENAWDLAGATAGVTLVWWALLARRPRIPVMVEGGFGFAPEYPASITRLAMAVGAAIIVIALVRLWRRHRREQEERE